MKKYIVAALAAALLCISAYAQNPTNVTGTLTDPSSVAYYPAQVTACLTPVTIDPTVGGKHVNPNIGANYCVGPVQTAPSGAFSMALYANGNITPGATQWIFTVQTAGSGPPAGKGAQTFSSAAVTVSGSSQDVSTNINSVGPAQLNSSSSSSPSSLASTTFGNFSLSPGCAVGNTNNCFFANGDTHFTNDATTTNTSNIITSATFNFTGTDAFGRAKCKPGMLAYATTDSLKGTLVLARTTVLSCDSATQIHTVGNATANQTANAFLYLGSDDTTNIAAFWTALGAACNATGFIASGIYMTEKGQFTNTPAACITFSGFANSNPTLKANGIGDAILMPTPAFDLTTGVGNSCGGAYLNPSPAGAPANSICFGGVVSLWENINIWGGGYQATSGTTFNGTLFSSEGGRVAYANFQGWLNALNSGSNANGVLLNNSTTEFRYGCACYFGLYPLVYGTTSGTALALGNLAQGGLATVRVLNTTNGASMSMTQVIGPDNGTSGNTVIDDQSPQSAGGFIEIDDRVQSSSQAQSVHRMAANSALYIEESTMTVGSGTVGYYRFNGAGASVFSRNSVYFNAAAANFINFVAAGTYVDQGGNSGAGLGAGVTGTGNVPRTDSADSTTCATGNWALTSGWGTTSVASVGANGNSHRCKVSVTTTVTGSASPVLTWTFPTAYPTVAPSTCSLFIYSNATITNVIPGTPSLTTIAFTLVGTPTATTTYIFDASCGP